MEEPSKINILFEKYLAGNASQEDIEKLYKHFKLESGEEELKLLIQNHFHKEEEISQEIQLHADKIAKNVWPLLNKGLETDIPKYNPIKIFKVWTKYAAVGVLIVAIGYGALTLNKTDMHELNAKKSKIEDIHPGFNHAILKVGNGKELELKGDNSSLVNQSNRILYADGTEIEELEKKQNITLRTPNGGMYSAILNDGTKVWLNAGSEIVYPSVFENNVREVYVKGEVYFEVVKDKARPFIVHSSSQKIEVLGTIFNVNAYENEQSTKTTLLTGSVRISNLKGSLKESLILSPNEQSIVGKSPDIMVQTVNPKAVTSWKNGYFNFHGMSLDESLKQIERWYDIKIVYKGKKMNGYLGGKMSRGVKLSSFVTFIEQEFSLKAESKADKTLILYDNPKKNKLK